MGFADWLEKLSTRFKRPTRKPRPTVADKLRARVRDLEARLSEAEMQREEARRKLRKATLDLDSERERADELDVRAKRLEGEVSVLEAQVEGQAKVIVCQQRQVDAMTAGASAKVAMASGGYPDAQRMFPRD